MKPATVSPPPELEIMRAMFAGTIHNIGNILTMAGLALNELEEGGAATTPPLVDMLLDEMLPTLEGHLAKGDLQAFLTEDAQGREYLAAMRDLLEYLRKMMLKQRSTIEALSAKMNHLSGIISLQQQLLMGMGETDAVTLETLMDDAVKMSGASAQRQGIEISRQLEPTQPVRVDGSAITQVLINLLKNAIEAFDGFASGKGPKIVLGTAERRRGGRVYSTATVADNGPGMSPDVLARAFDCGFTTKRRTRGERGVGLHFCRQTIEKFGGTIEVDTAPGAGAHFTIWLPVDSPAVSRGSGLDIGTA